jgi:hypothetical protein
MPDDEKLLDDFLASVAPTIEELVSRAAQQGLPLSDIAVHLERAFDGHVSGGCGARRTVAARLRSDARLSEEHRRVLEDRVIGTAPHQIPAVLFVQGEGYVAAAVKSLSGGLVGVS